MRRRRRRRKRKKKKTEVGDIMSKKRFGRRRISRIFVFKKIFFGFIVITPFLQL
jgi:hypothetical protein